MLKSTVQYLNKEHALDDYRDDDWDDERLVQMHRSFILPFLARFRRFNSILV